MLAKTKVSQNSKQEKNKCQENYSTMQKQGKVMAISFHAWLNWYYLLKKTK